MGIGLLLVVIVIAIIAIGGDKVFGPWLGSGYNQHRDARSILDERLARGEISREEYDSLRTRIDA